MSPLKDRAVVANYRIRNWLGLYPALFFPAMRLFGSRPNRERLLSSETELVIEGFPRSANTLAVVAFEMAQQRRVRLAHHIHVPAQVVRAVQVRVPVLVLVRSPEDAVVSLMVHSPWVPAAAALEAYWQFYDRIAPYSAGFVTATFEQVTTDYGAVIRRVNAKFGKSFDIFQHTKENVDKCFQIIEQKARARTGIQDVSGFVARPTAQKEKTKSPLKNVFNGRKEHALLEKCHHAYEVTLSLSQSASALQEEQALA